MSTVALAPMPRQWFGPAFAGYKLFSYAAGTLNKQNTFTDSTGATPNSNPTTLDANGSAATWFTPGLLYKQVLALPGDTDPPTNPVWTTDNEPGAFDSTVMTFTPTAVGGVSTTVGLFLNNLVLPTIAALKAVPKGASTQVFVTGYYAQGDGGGGLYYYDSTDTTSASNGGTIIVATDGGRWKLVNITGSPVRDFSVKQFGAKGDGATDDTTAVQAAITYVSILGGTLYFPPGSYLVNTATITLNASFPVKLKGTHVGAASIFNTVLNQTVLSVSGTRHQVEDLLIYSNQLWTSGAVVNFNNTIQCKMINCWVQGGFYPFTITGTNCTDNVFEWCIFLFGAGSAQVLLQSSGGVNGAHHFYRCLFNQAYPVQTPVTANYKGARGNTTAYNKGDVVTQAGYYWQCSVAGTTAGSAPTTLWYGNNIVDGTATWLLMGNTNARGIQVDSGILVTVFRECDITGAYATAIDLTNTLAGTAPTSIHIEDCNIDGPISNAIQLVSGCREIHIGSATQVTAPTNSTGTTYGILINSGVDGVQVTDCRAFGYTNGVYVGGTNVQVANCIILGNTNGIHVPANANQFKLIGNTLGSDALHGANTNSILIDAGTSNNFAVIGNDCVGAGSAITDNSTGGTKIITGNPGYNPRLANISTPGVPATTVALQNTVGCDVQVGMTNGNNTCTVAIGGRALVVLAANATYSFWLPVGVSVTLTYAGSTPAWNWLGN